MSKVIVGKWGKSLAIRVPLEIARAAGLCDGEPVEIEALDGDILIKRSVAKAHARKESEMAAEQIIADSKGRSLGGVSYRELRDEGLRG